MFYETLYIHKLSNICTISNMINLKTYSYPTSFDHICFKILIAEEFQFIVTPYMCLSILE